MFGGANPKPASFGFPASGPAPNTSVGFGANAPVSNFGANAPVSNFGANAPVSNFGANAPVSNFGAAPNPPPVDAVPLAEFGRQSALGRYLLEVDHAYNALHPHCRFRAMVYNLCAPGQSTHAVERDRLIAAHAGGGCREEELILAQERNPDPLRMYPAAVHFLQELRGRAEKQTEAMAAMTRHADALLRRAEHFRAVDESNAAQQRELLLEQVMLRRRWYALLRQVETLRQAGQPLGGEARLASAAAALNAQLAAPGVFRGALHALQPLLHAEAAAGAGNGETRAEPTGALRQGTDPQLLRSWTAFVERMQQGIEALDEVLEKDTADMRAIRERVNATRE